MGRIRKLITDVAVARAVKSGVADGDLIIVSNDADAMDVSEKYVSSLIETFDSVKNRHVDAVLGKIEWWNEVLKKYPTFYAANRFMQYLDSSLRHAPEGLRHVASSGANFAFRASIYSAAGGYDPDFIGEDVVLGTKIKVARAGESVMIPGERYPIKFSNRSRISTNPRRGLAKYLEGTAVAEQWDDFDKSDYIRDLNIDEFVARPLEEFDVRRLEAEINATIAAYRLSPDVDVVRRSLGFLKLSWHVEGGRVIIDDASRLKASFKRFADLVAPQRYILDMEDDAVRSIQDQAKEEIVQGKKSRVESTLKELATTLPGKTFKAAKKLATPKPVHVFERETLGLSGKDFEELARFAAIRSSAEQARRPFIEWIFLLKKAKELGVESDDLDELDGLSEILHKRRGKEFGRRLRERVTKNAALEAISQMGRA